MVVEGPHDQVLELIVEEGLPLEFWRALELEPGFSVEDAPVVGHITGPLRVFDEFLHYYYRL